MCLEVKKSQPLITALCLAKYSVKDINIIFFILPGNNLIEVFKLFGADPEAVAKAEGVGLPLLPHVNVLVDLVRHLAPKKELHMLII